MIYTQARSKLNHLVPGTMIVHPLRGPGTIVAVETDDARQKPYEVEVGHRSLLFQHV